MPGHVRLTDVCSGHGPCPPRANTSSSPDTYVNSIQATRHGDTRAIHCTHTGTDIGTHDVYVNNKMSQTCTDPVD